MEAIIEKNRSDEFVHHVTYLAMLAIVTTLIADQAFATRDVPVDVSNDATRCLLAFTYASTYWTAMSAVVFCVISSLISLMTLTRPKIVIPTRADTIFISLPQLQ